MPEIKKLLTGVAFAAGAVALLATSVGAEAAAVKIRVQSVIPAKADEVTMLNDFGANVSALTNGEVEIEVLPAGAVVGVKETLEAVDKGLIEGGFAWTHYWSGYHPAAMLFGSPVAAPASASTTSPGSPGSCTAAAASSTTSSGPRWA